MFCLSIKNKINGLILNNGMQFLTHIVLWIAFCDYTLFSILENKIKSCVMQAINFVNTL
jgi:hypothetical protein